MNKRWTRGDIIRNLRRVAVGEITKTQGLYYRVRSVASYHFGNMESAYKAAGVKKLMERRHWKDHPIHRVKRDSSKKRLHEFCWLLSMLIEQGSLGEESISRCMEIVRNGDAEAVLLDAGVKFETAKE